jgi:hypothetical protein
MHLLTQIARYRRSRWLHFSPAISRALQSSLLFSGVTILALFCMISGSVAAPKTEAASLKTTMSELYQAGKYAEAVPLAQRFLAIQD